MAVRAVPGVRPGGTGEEPAATLASVAATNRGARDRPSPPQAATLPRPATRPREILGDVPTVPLDSSSPDVPARGVEVSRSRRCTTPDSHRGAKRGLILGSSVLPDAHPGGIHHARSSLRLYEAGHSHSRAPGANRLPPAIAPANRFLGYRVASQTHASGDPGDRMVGAWQPQEQQVTVVAISLARRGALDHDRQVHEEGIDETTQ